MILKSCRHYYVARKMSLTLKLSNWRLLRKDVEEIENVFGTDAIVMCNNFAKQFCDKVSIRPPKKRKLSTQ